MAFEPVTNTLAYAKIGYLGLQGSGKTYTAAKVCIGLRAELIAKKLIDKKEPVYMCDTETGASWLAPMFAEAKVPFQCDASRSFKNLIENMELVSARKGIMMIDSITHFWKELCEAYSRKYRKSSLTFKDWGTIKRVWSEFTDLYVSGTFHCSMCGRQGYEYDFFQDDDGKKQLEKTGVKMKGEGETGYEPSLLVLMERHQELGDRGGINKVWRTAYILKDRANVIDGKSFENPAYENFAPHIKLLNLGGEHRGVVNDHSTDSMIPKSDNNWQHDNDQRRILVEEIWGLLMKHYESQSSDDKAYRAELLFEFFATRSSTKLDGMDLNELKRGYNRLHNKLEKVPAYANIPLDDSLVMLSEVEKQANETF